MQKLISQMRRCIRDYRMIEAGDRIAVGVSGGKDSLLLLRLLAEIRGQSGMDFSLHAISLDLGFGDSDYSPIADFCASLDVPYTVIPTQIGKIVFDARQEDNPCSLCAKMRRGALHQEAKRLGCSTVALGHHFDDAVETFALSLIYEGRLSCFSPVTRMEDSGLKIIRPMLYLHEKTVENAAKRLSLPVLHNPCPADKHTKREDVKQLLYELEGRYPGLKEHIFGGMQRAPLTDWKTKE